MTDRVRISALRKTGDHQARIAKLHRWVLKDGIVVTTTNGFPQSDYAILRTFDGHYMFVPLSNVSYVMDDVASVTGTAWN